MGKPVASSGRLAIFATAAVLVFLLDQWTKWVAARHIPYGTYHFGDAVGDPLVVIPDFFYLVHILNRGAAWGMLEGATFFLGIIGVVALGAIVLFRRQLELHLPWVGLALGLAAGGIAGNIIDRLLRGGVVDFIDIHLPALSLLGFSGYRWPAFNIADSGITTGVILYLLYSFFMQAPSAQQGRSGG